MKKLSLSIIGVIFLSLTLSARQPSRGYRGFIDFAWSTFSESIGDDWKVTANHYGLSTVHGYQIIPELFVGAGFELANNATASSVYLPVFADVRTDLKFGRFTPFADMRVGWAVCSDGGFRLQPMVGYRFNWGRKVGINLAVGMTLQCYKTYDYSDSGWIDPDGYQHQAYRVGHRALAGFTLRLGFDF